MLSAILLIASYPPFEVAHAAWVALIPLLLLWDRSRSIPLMMAHAYSVYVLFFAISFFWPLLNEYPKHGVVAVSCLMLLPLCMAIPFALSVPVRRSFSRTGGLISLFAGSILVETALLHLPWGFPWLLLGNTQSPINSVLQMAEIGGVLALSSWLWMVNGLGLLLLARSVQVRFRCLAALLLTGMIYGTVQTGMWRIDNLPPPGEAVSGVLVHPNVPDREWLDPYNYHRLDDLILLSESVLRRRERPPEVILWPEGALPIFGQPEPTLALYDRLQRWVEREQTALLTGALSTGDDHHWTEDVQFQSTVLLFQDAQGIQEQHRAHLLPYIRAITFRKDLTVLSRSTHLPIGFATYGTTSSTPTSMVLGPKRMGVLQDVEAWFGHLSRHLAQDRVGFLVILTRGGWWSNTPGHRAHLSHARLRAVETRRSVVQVANRGISGVVLPDGSIATEITTRTAWRVDIPTHEYRTLYSRYGDWPAGLAGALLLFVTLTAVWYPPRKRSPST